LARGPTRAADISAVVDFSRGTTERCHRSCRRQSRGGHHLRERQRWMLLKLQHSAVLLHVATAYDIGGAPTDV